MANKRINEIERLNEKPAPNDLTLLFDSSENKTVAVPYANSNPTIYTSSIEVSGSMNGITLQSPDNSRWLIRIDNSGTLTRTKI